MSDAKDDIEEKKGLRVDIHAHCYPQSYIDELKKVGIDESGGIGLLMVPWTTAEKRIESMDKLGVDVQFLSISTPGTYFSDERLSLALAQMTNDFISEICKKFPNRFMSFASIPLPNIKDAIEEVDRAKNKLDMDGIFLGTNINGQSLVHDGFIPFYEELNRRKMKVAIHPMIPIYHNIMPVGYMEYGISFSIAFLFETSMAVTQMAFKGIFERFPDITFILPHSGGTIPFIYPRIDVGYETRPPSHPMRKIPHPPSYYFKKLYYETAFSYKPSSLRCTLDLAGVDHLLFGTDYPYAFGPFARDSIKKIEDFGFSEEEREKVFFKNAMKIFPQIKEKLKTN